MGDLIIFIRRVQPGSENLQAECGGDGWALIEWKHGRTSAQHVWAGDPEGGSVKTAEELGLLGTSLIIVRPIQKPPSQAVEKVASLDSSEPEIE